MVAGKAVPADGEAIVPAVLANLTGLQLGDEVYIAARPFRVVGLSKDTFSMANSVTFVTLSNLADIMSTFGSMSYFLVDAEPGIDPASLAARIRSEVDKVNAVPKQRFIDNDWSVAIQMGLEIIELMTVIGGALAVLLTGFTVYVSTARKEREIAVMKALGVRSRAIYTSVMIQAAWLALLGFMLAAVLVFLAIPITASFVPQVTLHVTTEALVRVGIVALFVALLSLTLTARKVLSVDPMTAFRT
jgi:putative ABC transport system permease protein